MARKKKKEKGHPIGIGCDPHYIEERKKRKCSCGRPGIGLSKYGVPVCEVHNTFPTQKVKDFPPMPDCPGPHV